MTSPARLADRLLEKFAPKATATAGSCPLPSSCYYTGAQVAGPCNSGFYLQVQCGPQEGYATWYQCYC